MKLIKPSFEILTPTDWREFGIQKFIELVGRTCYKSEDKITDDSYKGFVQRMIDSKHYAMLEHGTVYLEYKLKSRHAIGTEEYNKQEMFIKNFIDRYSKNKYSIIKTNKYEDIYLVTTNYRVLIENGWINDIKYLCEPTKFHDKRITVKFICNRQVSHEFVRHRVFSFAQESTRYCNYTKGKFGGELTFIKPCWWNKGNDFDEDINILAIEQHFKEIEFIYSELIRNEQKPQQAATILPNALKTELVMTGFEEDWKHFFDLRAKGTTGAPHPQAKELAEPLMNEFIKLGYLKDYD